jgi:hypothetical protein
VNKKGSEIRLKEPFWRSLKVRLNELKMCLNTIKSFKQKLNKKPVKEVKLSLAMFEEKAKEKEREKFI